MVRVFVFLTAVQLILVVLALISCLSAERVRVLPRALWVLAILFVPLAGPAAYLAVGRPIPDDTGGGTPLPAAAPRRRMSNPDDDPDFLRSLDAEQSRRDRAVLAELERQFHSTDEYRRRDNDTPPSDF